MIIVSELFPKHRVTGSNSQSLRVHFWPDGANESADNHHRGIHDFWVSFDFKFAFTTQPNNLAEHLAPWDSHMGKLQKAIIFSNVADLGSDIAHLHTRHRIQSIISNFHKESMNSHIVSLHQQPRKD